MQQDSQLTFRFRVEEPKDHQHNYNMAREAFWNLYQPGSDEHYLTHLLRSSPDFIPELSLVAELQGKVVGHIVYSRSKIVLEDSTELPTATFGPVCVDPSVQARGIGSQLIKYSLAKAKQLGYGAVTISGHPEYYMNKFGFKFSGQLGLMAQDGVAYRGMMALQLKEGYLANKKGTVKYSPVFESIKQEELAEFDKQFPAKEKYRTVSQQIFEKAISLTWKDAPDYDHKLIFCKERVDQ